jgi:glycosyltransferase involved in cell wall biosynthesis
MNQSELLGLFFEGFASMKIVVDGFNLALEKGTGVATYARNLTSGLRETGHEVHVLYGLPGASGKNGLLREVAFFDGSPSERVSIATRAGHIFGAVTNPFARPISSINLSGAVIYKQFMSRLPAFDHLWNSPSLYEQAAIHFHLYGRRLRVEAPKGADLTHWTYPLPVKACGTTNIYTLHDLVPLRLPYTTLDKKREYYNLVKLLGESADHIVTVSETSKKDIMSMLGVPESKITNTYQSVSIPEAYLSMPTRVLRAELAGAFRLQYKKYLLFFGSIEPKKNISRIIEAYLASGIDFPLVVVGAQAWKSEKELKLLKQAVPVHEYNQSQPGPKIVQLEYASFPQLVKLIRGALAVTFPSLYEGFGLPILEGMICGTPVITSNVGSMLEIAGDAAILVDPYDTREIKDAMVEVVRNAGLRAEKVACGALVAKRFSPEAYQKRLDGLYSRVKAPIAAATELLPQRA